jgi:hypothetical protein
MSTTPCSRIAAALAAMTLLLAAGPAAADGFMSGQVGVFAPWQGDPGFMASVQMLGSGASRRSRWGGEFEYRNFETKVKGVSDVGVSSYVLRALWQYHFRPEAVLTPYIGLGLGMSITAIDDNKVNNQLGIDDQDHIAGGFDGLALLGVSANIPGADYMSVFVEGRLGLAFATAANDGDWDTEDVGGGSGSAGLRFRF